MLSQSEIVRTATAALTLSKTAWKLGISLSKLDQDTRIIDTMVRDLAGEVKSLGNECDLAYAELDEVASKNSTGSHPPESIDDRIWDCLVTQMEETSRTMQELELFIRNIRGEVSTLTGQAQRQRIQDSSKDQIATIRRRVCGHTDNLQITLLLINIIHTYIVPRRADRGLAKELEKVQDVVQKLQRSSGASPQSRPLDTEVILMQCAREVVMKGTTIYEASLAADSVAGGQGAAHSNIRVAEWVGTLESIRRDQRLPDPLDNVSNMSSIFSGNETHTVVTSATSEQQNVTGCHSVDAVEDDSDNDLDTDFAKAALDTGTKAFEMQDWEEADSLLQEALRVLQQLPKQQRAFCDIFDLQYKLAICAYHTQEPADAEEALMSLVQQSASSDEQRSYICDAAHLLSHLYIRMGQIDRARSECEKVLQARRRLLGKRSEAALESTALMAHIYALLNNRARAKLCLAMIPEARRDAVTRTVQESLGTRLVHLDSSSPRTRSISGDSDMSGDHIQGRLLASSSVLSVENRCYGPVSPSISQSPAITFLQSHQRIPLNRTGGEDQRSIAVTSLSSAEDRTESKPTEMKRAHRNHSTDPEVYSASTVSLGGPAEADEALQRKSLSRKDILDKVGCQPKDHIEEAVCNGDHSVFLSLLSRKRDHSWRTKMLKRGRPERVTALHFAALFGEIDMARRLLASSYNINEVPYGYTTSLTPLKFAIGARQVDMVEFLIANGAKPSEPDSWSTLAGQLMNRSWLVKTMSESDKEYAPTQMVAILRTLLKHGWDINMPFEPSGRTVLHQAVTFWTGSYKWDLHLRAAMTSFLCDQGADPFQANAEGKTPYDMASASGHQDLLLVLSRGSRKRNPDDLPMEPVELPSELAGPRGVDSSNIYR